MSTTMYSYKDKVSNIGQMNAYMLAKTLSMFEYQALPESLPSAELERLVQTSGYAFVTEVNGELYAFTGGLGGVPDVYGNPTQITISSPALNFNKTLSLKDDGVLFINDSCRIGLLPMFNKHNTLLAENDINMVMYGYNTRVQKVFSASDDRTKASAEAFLKKTIDGEIGVIGENAMFDGVKIQGGTGDTGSIMTMIEYHQYIKSNMFNEIGLGQNHNMKKERVLSAEVDQIKDSIYPYIYDMLKCRIKAIEKLNSKYKLEIEVDFGSVWNVNVKAYVDDVIPLATAESANTTSNMGVGVVGGEAMGVEVEDVPAATKDVVESKQAPVVEPSTTTKTVEPNTVAGSVEPTTTTTVTTVTTVATTDKPAETPTDEELELVAKTTNEGE